MVKDGTFVVMAEGKFKLHIQYSFVPPTFYNVKGANKRVSPISINTHYYFSSKGPGKNIFHNLIKDFLFNF